MILMVVLYPLNATVVSLMLVRCVILDDAMVLDVAVLLIVEQETVRTIWSFLPILVYTPT